jgi:Domain of unknown function (DUF4337)
MAEFNAARTLRESDERMEMARSGGKLTPVLTSIVAVLAAVATLFSNHAATVGLQFRTQAGISQTKASDQYAYYESKRIKSEISEALIEAGVVTNPAALKSLESRVVKQTNDATAVLKRAHAQEEQSEAELVKAERSMRSYESHEVAATLFEVAIVIVSITALMRRSMALLVTSASAALVGLAFFVNGLLH